MADLNPILTAHITKWQNLDDKLYYLKYEVTDAEDIPPEIFVMEHNAFTQQDNFVNVAVPVDLVTFPADSPNEQYNFFRVSTVELTFVTANQREESIANINNRIQQLLEDWKKIGGQLEDSYDVTFSA